MRVLLSRAKSFVSQGDERSQVFTAGRGIGEIPDWVENTPTFEHGVKDGSIELLSPRPVSVPPPEAPKAVSGLGAVSEPIVRVGRTKAPKIETAP